MRVLFKLFMKLAMFAAILFLSSTGLRQGAGLFGGGTGKPGNLGVDGAPVTNEEADLAGTVLKSAVKLVSGQASRTELSNELSEKLYGQRGDPSDMAELGIELVTPKGGSPLPLTAGNAAGAPSAGKPGETTAQKRDGKPGEKTLAGTATAQKTAASGASGAPLGSKLLAGPELVSGKGKAALSEIWQRMKRYSVELGLVPVVFIGMVWVGRVRRRKGQPGFVPEFMAILPESDSEKHVMQHALHSLPDEEFELLMALLYQRQGYRVSLSAALASGQACRFKLARKAERLLVQCHNFKNTHRVEVGLVRDLHEAMADASVTGGLFVASCGYTWDARHFAKTRNIKLISAKTLDLLLTQARETPDENLLAITPWLSKFMTKAEMTTPCCPECEAEMDETKEGDAPMWLCNQRPECGGRRDVRKYRKGLRVAAQDAGVGAGPATAPPPAPEGVAAVPGKQRVLPPKTPEEAPKPAVRPAQDGGKVAAAQNIRPAIANPQREHLPEILRGKPVTPQKSAQGGSTVKSVAVAGSPPAAADSQSAPATPVVISAEGALKKKSGETGGTARTDRIVPGVSEIAAQTADTNPGPAPGANVKRNLGLLSSVVEEFKRRGFRSEEPLPAKRKPASPKRTSRAA